MHYRARNPPSTGSMVPDIILALSLKRYTMACTTSSTSGKQESLRHY